MDQLVIFAAAAIAWVGVTPPNVTAPTWTTYLTPSNCRGGLGGSRVIPMSGTIVLPTTPTILADLGVGLHGAITTQAQAGAIASQQQPQGFARFFDGAIGVGPGGTLSFQVSTAGGASGCAATWIWEEIPQYGFGPALAA